jgi:hypothetical protein
VSGKLFYEPGDDLPRAETKARAKLAKAKPPPKDLSHWRYPFGYRLKLLGEDGSFQSREAADYADAKEQRRAAMRTSRYWCIWIEMRTT